MDCWFWSSGVSVAAVHDGRDCVQVGYQLLAAFVSVDSLCWPGPLSRAMYRLVAMMGFMMVLWALVPSKGRQRTD